MTFFDDFAAALQTYPADSVTLKITDVSVETGTSGSVNVNEIWKFKVKVENNGNINMANVILHVSGENNATLSTAGKNGPFKAGLQEFGSLTVNAGGSQKSDFLYFKAPSKDQPTADLVSAHIFDWDADLAPLLENNAGHSTGASDTYPAQVFP